MFVAAQALRGAGLRVLVSDCPTDDDDDAELPGMGWHVAKRARVSRANMTVTQVRGRIHMDKCAFARIR